MNEIIENLRNEVKDGADKLIIIINGDAGSGKTYLVNSITITGIPVLELNTVDIYKSLMVDYFNWDGQKDLKTRSALHELKKLHIEYNEGPLRKIIKTYNEFVESDFKVLFLHIGEAEEIEKVKYVMKGHCDVKTILIESPNSENIEDPRYGENRLATPYYDIVYINRHNIHSKQNFGNLIKRLYNDTVLSKIQDRIPKPTIYIVYPKYNKTFISDKYIVNHNIIINKSYHIACDLFQEAIVDIYPEMEFTHICPEERYVQYAIDKFKKDHHDNESIMLEIINKDIFSTSTLQNILNDQDITCKLLAIGLDDKYVRDISKQISDRFEFIESSKYFSCLDQNKENIVYRFIDYVGENQK